MQTDDVEKEDLLRGSWDVPKMGKGFICYNANSVAMDVILEIDDTEAEDPMLVKLKG